LPSIPSLFRSGMQAIAKPKREWIGDSNNT
ncbi:unnamed protein product, partial [Rotaria magnacalcarata]